MADHPVDILLVSHTHWDREWYRTFEAFRARLVDTVDRVLELLAEDPGWKFVLDGQSIVVEDYLAVRPGRRADLEQVVRDGRLALGPWYVQPDSLLPAGESLVRNLLEGRRVAESVGACSTVAYVPDSFGHPAQFPQLFAGFGLGPMVYWRGNGDELDRLGPIYQLGRARRQQRARVPPRARLLRRRGAAARPGHGGRRPARRAGPPRPDRAGARAAHERYRPHVARRPHRGGGRRAGATHGTSRDARSPRRSRGCDRPGGPRRAPR